MPRRKRDRAEVSDQVASLARGASDTARQVAEFGRRLGAAEGKVETRARQGVGDGAAACRRNRGNVARWSDSWPIRSPPTTRSLSASECAMSGGHRRAADLRAPASAGSRRRPRPRRRPPRRPPTRSLPSPGSTATPSLPWSRSAIEAQRIDLYLQPIVTLPQRKVRYYEAMSRLKAGNGEMVAAADFLPYAEAGSLMPKLDSLSVLRCVQVVRRLLVEEPRHRPVLQSFAARR